MEFYHRYSYYISLRFTLPSVFSFQIALNYSKWGISTFQDLSQRVSENSLVRCIGGETNFRFQQKVDTCACASLRFFLPFCCQASRSTHLWGYVCVLKTFDKNLKSLLKHYDKIMFSCLNANSCGHVVSLCLMVLWFCLSVSNKQWLVSQSCFLPLCPFATTSELLKISAAFMANEDCLI